MNRKLVSHALDQIDDELIAEAMTYRGQAPERMIEMKQHRAGIPKKLLVLALAACLALALAAMVYAANLWGIREMLRRVDAELPEGAVELIEARTESGAAETWSARITESLCDAGTMMVTVTVNGGDRYLVVPTDANPDDPLGNIGIDADGTLAEYAAARGRTLLYVGARIEGTEDLGIATESQDFQSITDGEMTIFVRAGKSVSAPEIDAICTVYAVEDGAREAQRVEIPFTMTEGRSRELGVFAPDDPDAVPGVHVGEASVTETPLGINVSFPVAVTDEDAFRRILTLDCEELDFYEGGFVLGDDEVWHLRWTMGRGSVGDTLTVRFLDWDKQTIGEIVFTRH